MQGTVQLDADAMFGGVSDQTPAPAPDPTLEGGTPPADETAQGQDDAAATGADGAEAQEAEAAGKQAEPDLDQWEDPIGPDFGGRLKSPKQAAELLRRYDKRRIEDEKRYAALEKRLEEMHSHVLTQSNAVTKALGTRQEAAPQRQQAPLITAAQVEAAYNEGNPKATQMMALYSQQQADLRVRAMAAHIDRQQTAKLDAIQKKFEANENMISELAEERQGMMLQQRRDEGNAYLESLLPEDLPQDVRDSIDATLNEIVQTPARILSYTDLGPNGHVRDVDVRRLINEVVGGHMPMIRKAMRGGGETATAQPQRPNKAALTNTLAPSKKGMPSSERSNLKGDEALRVRLAEASGNWRP